jgi:hypothetical protein
MQVCKQTIKIFQVSNTHERIGSFLWLSFSIMKILRINSIDPTGNKFSIPDLEPLMFIINLPPLVSSESLNALLITFNFECLKRSFQLFFIILEHVV